MDGPKYSIVIGGPPTKTYKKYAVSDSIGLLHKLSGPADLQDSKLAPSTTKTIEVEGEMITLSLSYLPVVKQNELQFKQANVILLVFSILDPNSLKEITQTLLPDITESASAIPLLLIGIGKDKRDEKTKYLSFKKKCVPYEELLKQVTQLNLQYLECSLKTNEGLTEIWDEIIKFIPSTKSTKSPLSVFSKLGAKLRISNKSKPPDKASRRSDVTPEKPPDRASRRSDITPESSRSYSSEGTPPEDRKPKSATISKGSGLKQQSNPKTSLMLEHAGTNYVIDFEGKTLDQLKKQIAKAVSLGKEDFFVEGFNKKFDRYVKVTELNQLEDGMIIRLKFGSKPTKEDEDTYNIDYKEIKLGSEIGKGAFGTVFKARWRNCDCVVKQLKLNVQDENSILQFKKEAEIGKKLRNHKNVCSVFGICTNPQYPICIVMEYVEGGSLKNLVYDDTFPLDVLTLIRFGKDVASGMSHIHKENLLHCDLACRNLLFEAKGNNKYTLKVTDFGLARLSDTGLYNASMGALFPIRWSAPEVLAKHLVSRAGDVWSFGVVLWEMSEGKVPYHELENPQVIESVCEKNYILPPPKRVKSGELYNIMKLCWERIPEKRPSFDDLFGMLEELEKKMDASPTASSPSVNNDNQPTSVYFSMHSNTTPPPSNTSTTSKKNTETSYASMNIFKLTGKKDKDK